MLCRTRHPERSRSRMIRRRATFLNTTSLSGIMRNRFRDTLESYRAILPG